jgi:putative membrane protein
VRNNLLRRTTAVAGGLAILGFLAAAPAGAAGTSDEVEVVNTETVQVYMSADGDIDTKRVYEQLALTGKGNVDLANPIATAGLRNLDGFDGFEVKDGEQLVKTDVDGEKKLRSVSDYEGGLPLDIDVNYELDGRTVKPGDLVGESGKLEVTFEVENVTGKMQDVEVPDGKGGTISKSVEVPIPMVGSLTSVAPSNFTNVASKQANLAGDGKGGTKLSFTMTLFPPVGSTSATFGYTADVTDGVVPRVDVSALPINPLESPTFASAAKSYQGGADTGAKLTDGAVAIDANLLRLRDGAEELVAGLIKLREGSGELSAGLNDTAVPGAAKLAAGAEELSLGLLKLDDGAGKLADGATTARAGSKKLDTGANQLADGLQTAEKKAPALITGLGDVRAGLVLVNGGLTKMYNEIGGIPAKAKPLLDGIQSLIDGIGTSSKPDTLMYGVNAVRAGLTGALPKIQQMADGVYLNSTTDPGAYQKLGCATKVLNAVKSGTLPPGPGHAGDTDPCFVSATNPAGTIPPLVATSAVDPSDGLTPAEYQTLTLSNVITGLVDGRNKLATPDGAVNDTTLYGGLMTLKEQLQHMPSAEAPQPGAIVALAAVQCGLDNTSVDGITLPGGAPAAAVCKKSATGERSPGVLQGLNQLGGGIDQLIAGVIEAVRGGLGETSDMPADKTLRGGVNGLIEGIDLLSEGGGDLISGLGQLSDGSQELAGGTGQLSSGLGDLADGAGQLSDGTGKASDGGSQVADGAGQLSDGLGDAAEGSSLIFGGLTKAAGSAPALPEGAQRLSDEGTKKLIAAGESTTRDYGEMVSVITAGAERGSAEKMAYGAPDDAEGLTAYSYIIKGENGQDSRNLTRALSGLAVFGAAGGVFLLRRRGLI